MTVTGQRGAVSEPPLSGRPLTWRNPPHTGEKRMNVTRIAVAGLAAGSMVLGGVVLASPASADPEPTYKGLTWPVLRQGQTSENVRALQWLLNCHGDKVAVPSHFGPKTYAAVRSFQYKNGNKVDGIVGASTWLSLTGKGGFSYGERNDCVKGLQVALNKWRYNDDLPITGYFGPRTRTKLNKFQRAHALPVHAYADPKDWNKLVSTPAGK
ncbi:peptidoglycan-binding protein [Actinomadura decatromicini]|uniref:Peptidoglycan-binding protein n=2 Tax=Actinomadura decatromicini TaxID=2604572 RepID=A0A5D3FWR9_9ACTN|nr:peptidoglycan-binding protein [Actinomadura decatromicini]